MNEVYEKMISAARRHGSDSKISKRFGMYNSGMKKMLGVYNTHIKKEVGR